VVAIVRFASLAMLVVSVGWFISFRNEQAEQLDKAKRELRETLQRHAAGLSEEDWQTLPRAEQWLGQVSDAYEGDVVLPELRDEKGLDRFLRRPSLYVRGHLKNLADSHDVSKFVQGSQKDAFLDCLLDPMDDVSEKALLSRLAQRRQAGFGHGDQVELLGAALAGMPMLAPTWAEQIDDVESVRALEPLRKLVERAPLAQAKRAARAEVLLLVLDEANEPGTPVEIDGTARHRVRFLAFDLRAEREALRLRRMVDSEWISDKQRQKQARALVGCRLGVELRRAAACNPPCPDLANQLRGSRE
jgi:hypothetical protein